MISAVCVQCCPTEAPDRAEIVSLRTASCRAVLQLFVPTTRIYCPFIAFLHAPFTITHSQVFYVLQCLTETDIRYSFSIPRLYSEFRASCANLLEKTGTGLSFTVGFPYLSLIYPSPALAWRRCSWLHATSRLTPPAPQSGQTPGQLDHLRTVPGLTSGISVIDNATQTQRR